MSVIFDRADLDVFEAASSDPMFIGGLAMIAVGVGSAYTSRNSRAAERSALHGMLEGLGHAIASLDELSVLRRMSKSGTRDTLQRLRATVAAEHADMASPGNRVDVGVRVMLHAVAALFRRFSLPVRLTAGEKPSAFIRVSCQLSITRGKAVSPGTMRAHATAARVLEQTTPGYVWGHESGAQGMLLGAGALFTGLERRPCNVTSWTAITPDRHEYHFELVPTGAAIVRQVELLMPPESAGD